MPYVLGSLQQSGATLTSQKWANSCYDVDQTNTGHQPEGYDQWSVFYQQYRLHAIKFKTRVVNLSTTVPLFWGYLYSSESTFPYLGLGDILEDPTCTYYEAGVVASGTGSQEVTCFWEPRFELGMTKEDYDADSATAGATGGLGVGSNPGIQVFCYFWFCAVDRVSNINAYVTQHLEVYASLFNTDEVPPS